jgi:tubulin polyglutamylase TTLL2
LLAECSRGRGTAEQEQEDLVWICKPVGQSQGRGIFLFKVRFIVYNMTYLTCNNFFIFQELSDLNYASSAVVQRYVTNPLLIGGYKFDLRLYACIPSFRPLCVYLYREGLVRFSTDKFTLTDLGNMFRHLTNSSLNRLGPGYTRQKERIGTGTFYSCKISKFM